MSLDQNTPPQNDGYLLLFRGTPWDRDDWTPDQLQEIMASVSEWFDGLARQGKVVSAKPLFERATIVSGDNGRSVTDGPFPEAKEAVGGYLLLNADSMEEAVQIARSNPMLKFGLITEVREVATDCPKFYRIRQKFGLAVA